MKSRYKAIEGFSIGIEVALASAEKNLSVLPLQKLVKLWLNYCSKVCRIPGKVLFFLSKLLAILDL